MSKSQELYEQIKSLYEAFEENHNKPTYENLQIPQVFEGFLMIFTCWYH